MTALRRLPIVASAALLASCATSPGGRYVAGDLSDDFPGIETALALDPTEVPAGRGASIELTIANSTEREIRMQFPDVRQIVLLVRSSAGELLYTDDRSVALPSYLTLGPFEDWDHTIDWDGWVDLGGRRLELPPGRYQLQAGLRRAGALTVNHTAPVHFEIVAPD